MPIPAPRRVVIELEPGPGPMRGWLDGPGGARARFAGWLELCTLLDGAREEAVEAASADGAPAES